MEQWSVDEKLVNRFDGWWIFDWHVFDSTPEINKKEIRKYVFGPIFSMEIGNKLHELSFAANLNEFDETFVLLASPTPPTLSPPILSISTTRKLFEMSDFVVIVALPMRGRRENVQDGWARNMPADDVDLITLGPCDAMCVVNYIYNKIIYDVSLRSITTNLRR